MILKMKKQCELNLNALLLRDDTIIVFLIKQNCCRGIEPFLHFYCQAEFGYTNNIAIENEHVRRLAIMLVSGSATPREIGSALSTMGPA